MRIAVLSDVHSNLEALDSVLADVDGRRVERIYVLGDLVGYGADPDGVLRALGTLSSAVLLAGNHDLAATGRFDSTWFNSAARAAIEWTAEELSADSLSLLSSLEPSAQTAEALLVHGSVPDPAAEYVTNVDVARRSFEADAFQRCLFGHTHMPAVYELGADGAVTGRVPKEGEPVVLDPAVRVMINPGSVGQPRDSDPRASYLVLDTDEGTATNHRVAYDVAGAQRKIEAAGLPQALANRLAVGR